MPSPLLLLRSCKVARLSIHEILKWMEGKTRNFDRPWKVALVGKQLTLMHYRHISLRWLPSIDRSISLRIRYYGWWPLNWHDCQAVMAADGHAVQEVKSLLWLQRCTAMLHCGSSRSSIGLLHAYRRTTKIGVPYSCRSIRWLGSLLIATTIWPLLQLRFLYNPTLYSIFIVVLAS